MKNCLNLSKFVYCPFFEVKSFTCCEKSCSAFTLAEVLITLGVIGVVAAMTLPMMVEGYQKVIMETRLKKFYSVFNQAILRSINDNGPYEGWGYEIDRYDPDAFQLSFDLYLRPYLNIVKTQQVIYTNGQYTMLYYLADGSAFMYYYLHNRDIYYYPKDPVRCLKSQEAAKRQGVCQFPFLFAPNSTLGGTADEKQRLRHATGKGMEPYSTSWDGNIETLYDTTFASSCHPEKHGTYCTLLIQQNGWKFPKDYPRKITY